MLKNYLKTAWRNLLRNRASSFINISGLAIGMAVAVLIGLWIYDELSFNKNFKNHNRIAKVIQNVSNNGEVQTWMSVPYPLAEELRKNYGSDFKQVVLSTGINDHILSHDDKKLTKSGAFFEKNAPELFTMKMLRGDLNCLSDPSSIILSASSARAYFGNDDPLNKVMKIDNQMTVKVSGVYEDFPRNSSFADVNFMSTWDLLYNGTPWIKTMEDPWRPNAFVVYVQLTDNADVNKVSAKIKDVKLKKVNAQLAKKKPALFLHPMDNWHLYSEYKNGVNTGGAIQYVWMFGIIGVFVLLLACINFMNLSTARSEKRAKEVGIRKTVGSLRKQLILQFFNESLLTVFFSFVLALTLAQLTLPIFNTVADKTMSIPWSSPLFWIMGIGFTLFTGLIAGSYPAFYLSSFKPVKVLKGTFKAGRFAAIPRKVLVVLQFTVSVTLIIGTIIVYRQIQFAKDRPVGYTREGIVTIPMITDNVHNHFTAVKDELVHAGVIVSMTESGSPTTGVWNSSSGFSWPKKDPNLSIDFGNVSVAWDYGKTVGWTIKEGRDFSKEFGSDSSAFIINEAAAHFMGLEKPIGETVTWFGTPFTVIGVVKNMVMNSPYDEVRPVIYNLSNEAGGVILAKINPNSSTKDALSNIEKVFKKFNPEQPFEYRFTDEEYAKKFGNEERIGKLAGFFAALAIAISCLGLFGLTSFVAEQRKKEIGVRKILGASVFNLWTLLSKDFVTLVLISFLVAIPMAYYFMHNWLQNYQYRTAMSWWVFLAAGCGALTITLVTVSFQSIKAALMNPVKSLRTE